jgi:hypothetical protein
MEEKILKALEQMLTGLPSDTTNTNSAPLFKKVIANNAPIWTTVTTTPSVCFYLVDTTYDDYDGLRYNGTAKLAVYVYNKHKQRGLSLPDILSTFITRIRAEVGGLTLIEPSILNAYVSKTTRDGGTVLPYTIAELELTIEFVETKICDS